jgi:hypothetical protein
MVPRTSLGEGAGASGVVVLPGSEVEVVDEVDVLDGGALPGGVVGGADGAVVDGVVVALVVGGVVVVVDDGDVALATPGKAARASTQIHATHRSRRCQLPRATATRLAAARTRVVTRPRANQQIMPVKLGKSHLS